MVNIFHRKYIKMRSVLSIIILVSFVFTSVLPVNYSYAQIVPTTILDLPVPGTMLGLSKGFIPALVKGITVDPKNPLDFNFYIDKGDSSLSDSDLNKEAKKLVKYFLATLTTPEKDLWVNLSPYEKNRIIPKGFGETEMGRDLLAQDYILKQITSSLMYPEGKLGSEFWEKIYKEAREKYGVTDIPVDTFNKVWIVPEKAVVYEHGTSAFVVESRLKVMLEADYEAMSYQKDRAESRALVRDMKQSSGKRYEVRGTLKDEKRTTYHVPRTSNITSDIIRQIIIPALEKEVNEGKNFATLRQVYNSLILATWYKMNLKETLLSKVYVDRGKNKGIDVADKQIKQKIYDQYLESFKKGVYNYIKEDYDPLTQQIIPRKYFSGGKDFAQISRVIKVVESKALAADLSNEEGILNFSISFTNQPSNDSAMISSDNYEEIGKWIRDFKRANPDKTVFTITDLENISLAKDGKILEEIIKEINESALFLYFLRINKQDKNVVIEDLDVGSVLKKIREILRKFILSLPDGKVKKQAFYDEHLNADQLWIELLNSKYIDSKGVILDKFKRLKSSFDIELSEKFDDSQKNKIYNILKSAVYDFKSKIFHGKDLKGVPEIGIIHILNYMDYIAEAYMNGIDEDKREVLFADILKIQKEITKNFLVGKESSPIVSKEDKERSIARATLFHSIKNIFSIYYDYAERLNDEPAYNKKNYYELGSEMKGTSERLIRIYLDLVRMKVLVGYKDISAGIDVDRLRNIHDIADNIKRMNIDYVKSNEFLFIKPDSVKNILQFFDGPYFDFKGNYFDLKTALEKLDNNKYAGAYIRESDSTVIIDFGQTDTAMTSDESTEIGVWIRDFKRSNPYKKVFSLEDLQRIGLAEEGKILTEVIDEINRDSMFMYFLQVNEADKTVTIKDLEIRGVMYEIRNMLRTAVLAMSDDMKNKIFYKKDLKGVPENGIIHVLNYMDYIAEAYINGIDEDSREALFNDISEIQKVISASFSPKTGGHSVRTMEEKEKMVANATLTHNINNIFLSYYGYAEMLNDEPVHDIEAFSTFGSEMKQASERFLRMYFDLVRMKVLVDNKQISVGINIDRLHQIHKIADDIKRQGINYVKNNNFLSIGSDLEGILKIHDGPYFDFKGNYFDLKTALEKLDNNKYAGAYIRESDSTVIIDFGQTDTAMTVEEYKDIGRYILHFIEHQNGNDDIKKGMNVYEKKSAYIINDDQEMVILDREEAEIFGLVKDKKFNDEFIQKINKDFEFPYFISVNRAGSKLSIQPLRTERIRKQILEHELTKDMLQGLIDIIKVSIESEDPDIKEKISRFVRLIKVSVADKYDYNLIQKGINSIRSRRKKEAMIVDATISHYFNNIGIFGFSELLMLRDHDVKTEGRMIQNILNEANKMVAILEYLENAEKFIISDEMGEYALQIPTFNKNINKDSKDKAMLSYEYFDGMFSHRFIFDPNANIKKGDLIKEYRDDKDDISEQVYADKDLIGDDGVTTMHVFYNGNLLGIEKLQGNVISDKVNEINNELISIHSILYHLRDQKSKKVYTFDSSKGNREFVLLDRFRLNGESRPRQKDILISGEPIKSYLEGQKLSEYKIDTLMTLDVAKRIKDTLGDQVNLIYQERELTAKQSLYRVGFALSGIESSNINNIQELEREMTAWLVRRRAVLEKRLESVKEVDNAMLTDDFTTLKDVLDPQMKELSKQHLLNKIGDIKQYSDIVLVIDKDNTLTLSLTGIDKDMLNRLVTLLANDVHIVIVTGGILEDSLRDVINPLEKEMGQRGLTEKLVNFKYKVMAGAGTVTWDSKGKRNVEFSKKVFSKQEIKEFIRALAIGFIEIVSKEFNFQDAKQFVELIYSDVQGVDEIIELFNRFVDLHKDKIGNVYFYFEDRKICLELSKGASKLKNLDLSKSVAEHFRNNVLMDISPYVFNYVPDFIEVNLFDKKDVFNQVIKEGVFVNPLIVKIGDSRNDFELLAEPLRKNQKGKQISKYVGTDKEGLSEDVDVWMKKGPDGTAEILDTVIEAIEQGKDNSMLGIKTGRVGEKRLIKALEEFLANDSEDIKATNLYNYIVHEAKVYPEDISLKIYQLLINKLKEKGINLKEEGQSSDLKERNKNAKFIMNVFLLKDILKWSNQLMFFNAMLMVGDTIQEFSEQGEYAKADLLSAESYKNDIIGLKADGFTFKEALKKTILHFSANSYLDDLQNDIYNFDYFDEPNNFDVVLSILERYQSRYSINILVKFLAFDNRSNSKSSQKILSILKDKTQGSDNLRYFIEQLIENIKYAEGDAFNTIKEILRDIADGDFPVVNQDEKRIFNDLPFNIVKDRLEKIWSEEHRSGFLAFRRDLVHKYVEISKDLQDIHSRKTSGIMDIGDEFDDTSSDQAMTAFQEEVDIFVKNPLPQHLKSILVRLKTKYEIFKLEEIKPLLDALGNFTEPLGKNKENDRKNDLYVEFLKKALPFTYIETQVDVLIYMDEIREKYASLELNGRGAFIGKLNIELYKQIKDSVIEASKGVDYDTKVPNKMIVMGALIKFKEEKIKELKESEEELKSEKIVMLSQIKTPAERSVKYEETIDLLLTSISEAHDNAMVAPGGIDLNPGKMELQIKRDDSGMPLPISDQPTEIINIEGLTPVIINVTPVTNLPLLLGLEPHKKPAKTAKLI